jgi:hypothetical protein
MNMVRKCMALYQFHTVLPAQLSYDRPRSFPQLPEQRFLPVLWHPHNVILAVPFHAGLALPFSHDGLLSFECGCSRLETVYNIARRNGIAFSSLTAQGGGLPFQLIVQDHIQERTVNFQSVVVVNETQVSELVHELIDPGAGRPHHLCQGGLTDFRQDRLQATLLSKVSSNRRILAKRFSLELNSDPPDLLQCADYGKVDGRRTDPKTLPPCAIGDLLRNAVQKLRCGVEQISNIFRLFYFEQPAIWKNATRIGGKWAIRLQKNRAQPSSSVVAAAKRIKSLERIDEQEYLSVRSRRCAGWCESTTLFAVRSVGYEDNRGNANPCSLLRRA